MTDRWQETTWGDLATLEYGKRLSGYGEATGNVPVFGTNGPIGWHDTPLSPGPTVVVGRKGAYRGIHYSPNPCFVIDTAFYLSPRVDLDIRWAYYELLTHDINAMDSGSAIPSTSRDAFYSLPVLVPPRDEQRAVAAILGALDDKIELNRRRNETLEATAQAVYTSWFVDFDPVRAKVAGREPGLPEPLVDLLPSRLAASELGEIPEGWGPSRLSDAVDHLREKINPGKHPDIAFLHHSIPAFDKGEVPVVDPGESIRSQKSIVPSGVVLVSRLNPEIERVWIPDVDDHDQAIASTEFLVLLARPPFTRAFVYCTARSRPFRQRIESLVTGTSKSHQRAQTKTVLELPLISPPGPILERFDEVVSPLLERVLAGRRESMALRGLRDALLPKLASGELRVQDAEQFVEAVA